MSGKITQKHIAEALKLSPITVSRVFNSRGYISEDTRSRVLEYAKSVGYTPDKAARALVCGTVARLSIIITDDPPFFWEDVSRGIQLAAQQLESLGFQVRLRKVRHTDPKDFAAALEEELREKPDVLAVSNTARYPLGPELDRLLPADIPLVLFSVDLEHPSRVAYVGPDYYAAGRLAGEAISKFTAEGCPVYLVDAKIDGDEAQRQKATATRRAGFLDWFAAQAEPPSELRLGLSGREIKDGLAALLAAHKGRRLAFYCISSFIEELALELQRLEPEPRPILIGHDLSPLLLRFLSEGVITAEIFQDPLLQGFALVKKMEQIATDGIGAVQGDIVVPNQLILAENRHAKSALELFMSGLQS